VKNILINLFLIKVIEIYEKKKYLPNILFKSPPIKQLIQLMHSLMHKSSFKLVNEPLQPPYLDIFGENRAAYTLTDIEVSGFNFTTA